jgi:hypothetical protein
MKKGDVIASVAQPIAKVSDYFLGTDLQNCAGCNKMKTNLNAGMSLADAFYDRFWPTKQKMENKQEIEEIEYTAVIQVSVKAKTIGEAFAGLQTGTIIAVNSLQPRPTRPQPQQAALRPMMPGMIGMPVPPASKPA